MNLELFYFINNQLSNPLFDAVLPWLSKLGSFEFIGIVTLLFFVLSLKNVFGLGKYHELAKLCIISLIVTTIITASIKLFFSAPRPYLVLSHVNVLATSVDPNSFPSGHSATTLSVASVLAIKSKEYFKKYKLVVCGLVIFAGTIMFSRVYLGMHYPTDVLAGCVIGMACGVVVTKFLKV